MRGFSKPGSIPLRSQSGKRRATRRNSGAGIVKSRTYDGPRECPGCSAELSSYNPDLLCRLCTLRGKA